MPIRPEVRHLYPPDWPALARRLKEAAGWRCERCGLQCSRPGEPFETMRNVLTVAHLVAVTDGGSHDPTNLRAWCAPCHLRYDHPLHARIAARTRRRRRMAASGQLEPGVS